MPTKQEYNYLEGPGKFRRRKVSKTNVTRMSIKWVTGNLFEVAKRQYVVSVGMASI